jgi:hypothetical protein
MYQIKLSAIAIYKVLTHLNDYKYLQLAYFVSLPTNIE